MSIRRTAPASCWASAPFHRASWSMRRDVSRCWCAARRPAAAAVAAAWCSRTRPDPLPRGRPGSGPLFDEVRHRASARGAGGELEEHLVVVVLLDAVEVGLAHP